MLAVPIKACVALTPDILPKMKASLMTEQAVESGDQLIPDEQLESQLKEFISLREAALRVENPASRSEADLDTALLRYASALCHGKIAMGTTLGDNLVFTFSWRDAFKPALVCHARSFDFERTAVLYNLGALYSQQAAQHVRSDLVGIRAARDGFQRAAGVFSVLDSMLGPGVLRQMGVVADACDLSSPGVRMTTSLMLAQAQACCYEEALKGGTGAGDASAIAKLAAAASSLYGEAVNVQKNAPELIGLDPSWAKHILFQHYCFQAVALWWRSKELAQLVAQAKAANKNAELSVLKERVDRLRSASTCCDTALTVGGGASVQQAQGLKAMVTQELVQAQLDLNSSDWADDDVPVSTTNTDTGWPELAQNRSAVLTPVDLIPRSLQGDLMESPEPLLLPLAAVPSRAMRLVANQECSRLSSEAQRLSLSLRNANTGFRNQIGDTSTILDAFSICVLGEVPDALWSQLEAWQSKGGTDALQTKMGELDTLASNAMSVLSETREMLSKEEGAAVLFLDASERAADQERIQVCQSAGTAHQNLMQRLNKLQEAWVTGRDADEKLCKTLGDSQWEQGCLLFAKDRNAIADELRRASKLIAVESPGDKPVLSASQSFELKDSLLESGEEVSLSSSEAWGRVEALKRSVQDIVPLLTTAIQEVSAILEAREKAATEISVVASGNKALLEVLSSAAQMVALDSQQKGFDAVSQRDAVLRAMEPMKQKVASFELEHSEQSVSSNNLKMKFSELLQLRDKFIQTRDAYDEARLSVANGSHNPDAVLQMQQEYKDRTEVIHVVLRRSSNAWKHLEQGGLWYADLAGRIAKLKEETTDHCFAQEMLRGDFGQANECEDDAVVALRMQTEMQGELDREYHMQLEQSHLQAQQQLPATPQIPSQQQPQQQQQAGVEEKTKLATKIPPGIGPGSRIKIPLPGSGREIELTIPAGMSGGDTLEFLVPNSYLLPPTQPDDIVVLAPPSTLPQQQQQQLPQQQAYAPPTQSPFPQSTASSSLPPNAPPPAYSGLNNQNRPSSTTPSLLNSNGQTPLIPDYSQSARSYSSEPPQEESLLTKADTFFKNMFGGSNQTTTQPQAQQRRFSAPPSWTPSPPAPPAPEPEPEITLDEEAIKQLMEMGFSRESVTLALLANRGEPEGALNALLTSDETEALRVSMN